MADRSWSILERLAAGDRPVWTEALLLSEEPGDEPEEPAGSDDPFEKGISTGERQRRLKAMQKRQAQATNVGTEKNPLMRPSAAAKPGTHAPTPSRLAQTPSGIRPAPQEPLAPSAKAAVPPSGAKTTAAVKEPTAAAHVPLPTDPRTGLPQRARGSALARKGHSQKSAWDDIRFSDEYQELDPNTMQVRKGSDFRPRVTPTGAVTSGPATYRGGGSSPSQEMPQASSGGKVRGGKDIEQNIELGTAGRPVQGQTKIKVAPPGQSNLPSVTGKQAVQPPYAGSFHGQRWAPRGQTSKKKTSYLDTATGDWRRGSRDVAGEGAAFVWDDNAGRWISEPEFDRLYPGQ